MIKSKKSIVGLVLATLLLAGCAQQPGPKESVGTLGGAVLGGLLGSQIGGGTGRLWATGAGAVLGSLVGSEVGRSLDRADKVYMAKTTQATLEHSETGSTSTWNNPDTGHSGA